MPKVIFIDILQNVADSHGIYSLSGYLKYHGIDVDFIGSRNLKKIVKQVLRIKPDFLLYSSFSFSVSKFIELDRILKKYQHITSIIGGPGATFDWKRIEGSSIDYICIGEGEFALVNFIKDGFKPVKNIFRNGSSFPTDFYPLVDLNKLPFPDRSVVYNRDSLLCDAPSKQFFSGRGCPYRCTYCFNHKFNDLFKNYGPVIRKKSIDYLFDEIRIIKKDYPLRNLHFNDDNFIIDRKWFFEFCERFPKEIGLTYNCNIRANLVDMDIVNALKNSNCRNVTWSIESGNDFLRNEVLKRGMNKEQILNAAELLNKHKITFRVANLIGLPGETFEQMLETVELNIKARPLFALANIFVPYPGLELTDYAKKNNFYDGTSEQLPDDYFTGNVMKVSKREKKLTYKLMCLFPIIVNNPFLFYCSFLRKVFFMLPSILLRLFYEIIYTYKMSRYYTPETSFFHKLKMGVRYIQNI